MMARDESSNKMEQQQQSRTIFYRSSLVEFPPNIIIEDFITLSSIPDYSAVTGIPYKHIWKKKGLQRRFIKHWSTLLESMTNYKQNDTQKLVRSSCINAVERVCKALLSSFPVGNSQQMWCTRDTTASGAQFAWAGYTFPRVPHPSLRSYSSFTEFDFLVSLMMARNDIAKKMEYSEQPRKILDEWSFVEFPPDETL